MTSGEAIKNELKVSIPLEFLYKKPSIDDNISYTLLSLINHAGNSRCDIYGVCWIIGTFITGKFHSNEDCIFVRRLIG